MIVDLQNRPNLSRLAEAQLTAAPQQEKFLSRRLSDLSDSDLQSLENIATNVSKLVAGNVEQYTGDYAWLCEQQVEEELYFRRNGRYRMETFEQAYREVYSNKEYMTRYMNGLLMTQLWWSNHSSVMRYYTESYLPSSPENYRYLEIGPGHGLFIYLAASDPRAGNVVGWDISEASIALTQEALRKLGLSKLPTLRLQDMFDNPAGEFDCIVFSEVLEHMEKPLEALTVLKSLLSERGRLFLNMPINSPAPDHLFNAANPEELKAFVEGAGLKVAEMQLFPATNKSLDVAIRKALTINCVFVCTR